MQVVLRYDLFGGLPNSPCMASDGSASVFLPSLTQASLGDQLRLLVIQSQILPGSTTFSSSPIPYDLEQILERRACVSLAAA